MSHAEQIIDAAHALGFVAAGVTSAEPLAGDEPRLRAWLDAGMHGGMDYLEKTPRHDPRVIMPEARAVVVAALAYPTDSPLPPDDGLYGRVARYARGADYHLVMRARLDALAARVHAIVGEPVRSRVCVDSAPLLERALALRAGLGFIGKNSQLILPNAGSFVVLGELLLDVPMTVTAPSAVRTCGGCEMCRRVCPTGALLGPHRVDARRCLSYLTIEHAGEIPSEWRRRLGSAVFGCDLCQEVCPYNQAPPPGDAAFVARPELLTPRLDTWLTQGAAAYRRLVQGTALRRTSRNTLARNAAVALGNSHDARAKPLLTEASQHHPSAVVRDHALWALGQI
jgi:epoxyqueuosine reductase